MRKLVPESIAIPVGTITAIDPSRRKPGRFELAIDGKYVARLSLDVIERFRLRVGSGVDETVATRLAEEAAAVRVYDRALSMLSARARSVVDLRRVLLRKGEPAAAVDAAMAKLGEAGFLNEEQFARQFTRAKAVGAGLPKRRIVQELRRRGVASDTATSAVEETFDEERIDERESIERVAEKKLRMLTKFDVPTKRRRLYAFLARRGYDSNVIGDVVRRLVQ